MTDYYWIEVANTALKYYQESKEEKPDDFFDGLLYKSGVESPLDKTVFNRLTEEEQRHFIETLKKLTNPNREEPPTREERLKYFEDLAQYYNCVFNWVETGEPGKHNTNIED